MQKRTFCKLIIGAALAMSLSRAAYADDVLAKVKAAGVMKVGTETEFAPFDYIDAGAHARPQRRTCSMKSARNSA